MFRFDDNESQSSGDSILIGVEEDKDFRDYKVICKQIYSEIIRLFVNKFIQGL